MYSLVGLVSVLVGLDSVLVGLDSVLAGLELCVEGLVLSVLLGLVFPVVTVPLPLLVLLDGRPDVTLPCPLEDLGERPSKPLEPVYPLPPLEGLAL